MSEVSELQYRFTLEGTNPVWGFVADGEFYGFSVPEKELLALAKANGIEEEDLTSYGLAKGGRQDYIDGFRGYRGIPLSAVGPDMSHTLVN